MLYFCVLWSILIQKIVMWFLTFYSWIWLSIFLTIPNEIPKTVSKLYSIEAWNSIGYQQRSKVVLLYVPRIPKNIQSCSHECSQGSQRGPKKGLKESPLRLPKFSTIPQNKSQSSMINSKSCSIDGQWMSMQISIVICIHSLWAHKSPCIIIVHAPTSIIQCWTEAIRGKCRHVQNGW